MRAEAKAEAEAERARARDCLSLACAAERADAALALALCLRDQEALGVITEAHPLLWEDFLREAARGRPGTTMPLPPRIRSQEGTGA